MHRWRSFGIMFAFAIGALAPVFVAGVARPTPDTPPSGQEDRARLHDELFRALAAARSEDEARAIEDSIWIFWTQGPDSEATAQMQALLSARRSYDTDKALAIANALTQRYPNYAEGWNQKATVLFMKEDMDASLEAIERVLTLEPKHFGALAGKAVILMRQGRAQLGQQTLRRAVAIHPFLKERGLLAEPQRGPL